MAPAIAQFASYIDPLYSWETTRYPYPASRIQCRRRSIQLPSRKIEILHHQIYFFPYMVGKPRDPAIPRREYGAAGGGFSCQAERSRFYIIRPTFFSMWRRYGCMPMQRESRWGSLPVTCTKRPRKMEPCL